MNVARLCALDSQETPGMQDPFSSRDAEAAGVSHLIDFSHGNCEAWRPTVRPEKVITNPPWGGRLRGSSTRDKTPSRFTSTPSLFALE